MWGVGVGVGVWVWVHGVTTYIIMSKEERLSQNFKGTRYKSRLGGFETAITHGTT